MRRQDFPAKMHSPINIFFQIQVCPPLHPARSALSLHRLRPRVRGGGDGKLLQGSGGDLRKGRRAEDCARLSALHVAQFRTHQRNIFVYNTPMVGGGKGNHVFPFFPPSLPPPPKKVKGEEETKKKSLRRKLLKKVGGGGGDP